MGQRAIPAHPTQGTIALSSISHVEAVRPLSPAPAALAAGADSLIGVIITALEDAKAEDITSLDLAGKSSIADYMVVATGRVDRHVGAIADRVVKALKDHGVSGIRVEGEQTCEWVLVDAGDVIVHVFKPDARSFYNIEKLWSADRPRDGRGGE